MYPLIAPSLLSANFLKLQEDLGMLNRSEADWYHLDVMDGLFVPNISFGFPVIEKIRTLAERPLDIHLMIVDPDRYLERFYKAGAEVISIHYEACKNLHRSVQTIKKLGAKAGVVLNPASGVTLLEEIIRDVDMVLLMSVNPGFGGQKFIENTIEKAGRLKELILKKNSGALIEVDGGVDLENSPRLVAAGVDILVAGHTIFASSDPAGTISRLKHS
jgi:ribulose-phosphate 3-epimerase